MAQGLVGDFAALGDCWRRAIGKLASKCESFWEESEPERSDNPEWAASVVTAVMGVQRLGTRTWT